MDFDEGGHPLDRERVARHLAGIEEFLKAFQEANPAKPFEFRDSPPFEKIASRRFRSMITASNVY